MVVREAWDPSTGEGEAIVPIRKVEVFLPAPPKVGRSAHVNVGLMELPLKSWHERWRDMSRREEELKKGQPARGTEPERLEQLEDSGLEDFLRNFWAGKAGSGKAAAAGAKEEEKPKPADADAPAGQRWRWRSHERGAPRQRAKRPAKPPRSLPAVQRPPVVDWSTEHARLERSWLVFDQSIRRRAASAATALVFDDIPWPPPAASPRSVLGVSSMDTSRGDGAGALKRAFRKFALRWHPDKFLQKVGSLFGGMPPGEQERVMATVTDLFQRMSAAIGSSQ